MPALFPVSGLFWTAFAGALKDGRPPADIDARGCAQAYLEVLDTMPMLETRSDTTGPRVQQISFFLQNRIGALLGVARKLEELHINICAVSILDSADHAVIRMVVDRPSLAKQALVEKGLSVFESELVAVELPTQQGTGLPRILSALLMAEVNVHYIYSLLVQCNGHQVVAFHVDDTDVATQVLRRQGLALVGQDQISWSE